MTASPRLGYTELAAGQAVPETTVNEMARYVEQGANKFIVKDKDLATPPGSPADGDCYIVASSPTGAWSGKATKLAFYENTAWSFITPIEGSQAYAQDENAVYEYTGAAWATPASGYVPGGTDVALADGGTGASLSDPNADRVLFWDDSAGQVTWLTMGTGLTITATTLDAAAGSGYTDEQAQDAVGTILTDSSTIDFTYNDGANTITAAVIPSAVKPTESLIVACSDETTALTTGTGKVTFRMPYAFTVSAVRASLTTAQASGSIFTVDINESGTTIISTKLTIDNTEKTTTTAATPAVISDSSLADDAEMTVDIDQIGDGTAKGLKIYLIGSRT